ncbi:MAG: hypothetical protein EXR15_04930 [Chitinophagaceae bacterium]|nr:hypothetical protein [Chitinophagaceae bacterium]
MERLDQVLFTMDTLHIKESILGRNPRYPFISEVLLQQMLAIDSSNIEAALLSFLTAYRPIFTAVQKINAPVSAHPQLQTLFKNVHYYFPDYPLPKKIIYFIGPLDGFGNSIGADYMAIGLQMFLGDTSSWYQSEQIQKYFPPYMSRNFTPRFIPITAAKNLLQDIAPNSNLTQGLIIEMIEMGKRQYILKKVLPENNDADLFGYSASQYAATIKAEHDIWNYLLKMNLVYAKDPKVASQLLNEGPFSLYFGNEIPGNVGIFIGYQIVKSWMEQQSEKEQSNLIALLQLPAEKIFAESKYKP